MDRKIVHFLWVLLIVTVTAIAGAVYAIAEGWIGYMPPIEDLQNPINRFATQVYSSDGKLMGTWNYNKENRVCVDYDQLAPSLIKALVATEDVRFHEHSGIDFKALARAIIKRGILAAVLPSPNSWPNSSTLERRQVSLNVRCKNPLNG